VDFERTTAFTYDTRTLDLDAFSELLSLLSDPQDSYGIIHVAGTKGKGSTCAMLASILQSSGLSVGLFTSPHLLDVRERIQTNGAWISETEFASILSEIKPAHSQLGTSKMSYRTTFELLTATALMQFANRGVELAVLETGLGGRLDSTNVVRPSLSVITRIGYDHTAVLGSNLRAIAGEKAGIIKQGIPVIVGRQEKEAYDTIVNVARSMQAPLIDVAKDFTAHSHVEMDLHQHCSFDGLGLHLDDVSLPVIGEHQVDNACCAAAAARLLSSDFASIDAKSIEQGLERVQLMGRIEVLGRRPCVILDCAHNKESAEALIATLGAALEPRNKVAILGLSSNKDAETVVGILVRYFDKFLVTKADTKRAMEPKELRALLTAVGAETELFERSFDAASAGLSGVGADDLLCATGSVYLAGELRPYLVDRLARQQ
ncbi:MAG: bifunctional folylpolyglutamate synthase/dihydrofolate synthase, partial [Candidatus Coatesbacteria bacterium]|nr:bifunctional folylpolyglutamate synthase/dihydrofolate synthase [Candidatus Coatesbacteria bacterium]